MTHLSSSSGLRFSLINGQIHGWSQEASICNLGLPLFSGSFTTLLCSYLVSEGGSSLLVFSWHFFLLPLLILFSFQSDFRGTILFLFIFYSILFAYLSFSLQQFFFIIIFLSLFFFFLNFLLDIFTGRARIVNRYLASSFRFRRTNLWVSMFRPPLAGSDFYAEHSFPIPIQRDLRVTNDRR